MNYKNVKGAITMKTLADLKRDAAGGKIKFELIERYGETGDEIPERLRGIRSVSKVNTVGITLVNSEGLISELRFEGAKLVEYDGKSLTIYDRGERDLTEQERKSLPIGRKSRTTTTRETLIIIPIGKRRIISKNVLAHGLMAMRR